MKLDKEEQDILDTYEAGDMTLKTPGKSQIKAIQTAATQTFRKNKRITIRLYEHDYKGIQKKALEMGLPYQTLISGMIHRYVEGDLIEKESIS